MPDNAGSLQLTCKRIEEEKKFFQCIKLLRNGRNSRGFSLSFLVHVRGKIAEARSPRFPR